MDREARCLGRKRGTPETDGREEGSEHLSIEGIFLKLQFVEGGQVHQLIYSINIILLLTIKIQNKAKLSWLMLFWFQLKIFSDRDSTSIDQS